MAVDVVNVSSLKKIKNNVIGNPSEKLRLAQDEVFIQTLVECLNRQPQDDIRIEAAHVISSISYGSQEALRSLLRADALQAFLYAISNFQPNDSIALKAAFARALRALAVAISDTVGPSQWGLRSDKSDVRYEAITALDCLFQLEYLDIYLPLLIDTSAQTSTSIAQLLASSVRTAEHRSVVADWLPSSDRIKEVKGKRGWEKPDTTNGKAPGRLGGWVARNLVGLLKSKDTKLQEAVLSALASLSKENPSVSAVLARASPDYDVPPPLATIMSLCKTRSTDVQLASSLCATHIIRACANNHSIMMDPSWAPSIMHVVNRMIASPAESTQNRTKACFILTYLVSDDPIICQIANDRGSLEKLATLVKSITPLPDGIPSQIPWETEEDEPESTSALREAALRTIASLCLFEHEPRHKVADTLHLTPIIHSSLSHTHVGVRFAAIQCVRMLSRAVAVLRTNIVDSGLGMMVFGIFKKEGEERNCVGASLATICNIVVDASPLRPKFIEEGGVARLVQLLNTDEPEFRLSSMWALKNLLCKTTPELKQKIMSQLGWSELAGLLSDLDEKIQEQAFCVVRNLAENESDIEMVFRELGDSVLLNSLVSGLESTNEDVVLQAAYALANISNGYETYQELIICHPSLLNSLRVCMSDAKVEVRLPAVNCVFQLIRNNPKRIREFHESGIVSTLRHISDRIGAVSLSPGGVGRLHGHHHHGVDDDKEISERARLAVDWLEHASGDPVY